MKVKLTPYEVLTAANIGVMRQTQNIKNGRADAYGAQKKNGWQLHIQGALGECAVAKALNLFWSGNIGNLKAKDVGNIQVRTRTEDWHSLILHKKDQDDDVFILVTGCNSTFELSGFILGKNGKKDEYWTDPAGGRPAYFVPQDDLNSIDVLMVLMNIK